MKKDIRPVHGIGRDVVASEIDIATSPAAKLAAGYLLTDTEVADLCGCAVQTVRNWRWKRDQGPRWIVLGKRMVRYRPADVQAFIEGQEEAA